MTTKKTKKLSPTHKEGSGTAVFELSSNMYGDAITDSSESGSILIDIKGSEIEMFRAGFALNVTEKEIEEIERIMEMIDEHFELTAFYPYNEAGTSSESPGTNKHHYRTLREANNVSSIYRSNTTLKGVPLIKFNSDDEKDIRFMVKIDG